MTLHGFSWEKQKAERPGDEEWSRAGEASVVSRRLFVCRSDAKVSVQQSTHGMLGLWPVAVLGAHCALLDGEMENLSESI